jgi:NitT/TauT family transport system ATP-binding protein
MSESVVSLRKVRKTFAGGNVTAVEEIDLDIQPGEFVSLIGPSGCGKSTLLRLIGDLTPATSGEPIVNGKSAHQARLDRDYGIVFQDAVLYDWRTVTRNITLPLELAGWSRARRNERAREMIELVELTGFEGRHPWELSGGMQQRVSIARALALEPVILLMDEPFGGLDAHTRLGMQEELTRIWQETGKTLLFVTHSVDEAIYLATRMLIIGGRPGRILEPIDVDLPRPRDRTSPQFNELKRHVLSLLMEQGESSR